MTELMFLMVWAPGVLLGIAAYWIAIEKSTLTSVLVTSLMIGLLAFAIGCSMPNDRVFRKCAFVSVFALVWPVLASATALLAWLLTRPVRRREKRGHVRDQ